MTDGIEKVSPENVEKFWEDLGRPAKKPILYAFTISMGADGAITTDFYETSDVVERKATTFDVYSICKDIVSDIEAQMMASRVSQMIVEQLKPSDPSKEAKDRLLSALNDRGIDTPKA